MTTPSFTVGLLGAGAVGAALIDLLKDRPELPDPLAVLVRDPTRPRGVPVERLTTDHERVLAADVVVELMGGTERAGDLMLSALSQGKRVVTANKAALAERWDEFAPHLEAGRLFFEAAVMAGTPVIGPLSGALRGSKPLELHAILNGTCNVILNRLEEGVAYDDALAEAQRLGYAEADPALDVTGVDAAHKLALLARLAFDPAMCWEEVREETRGIIELTPSVVHKAMEDGGRVRLVGSIYPLEGRWRTRVRPVYLPALHPLAGAASSRNGLLFRGDPVGEVFVSGAGAGAGPTASAVLADLITALSDRPGPCPLPALAPLPEGYTPERLGEVTP